MNDRVLVRLIGRVERVNCGACVSGSRIWVVLGASIEVCGVGRHQAAYVTSGSVGQHLFGVVGSALGAPSVPSNYGPPAGIVDIFNLWILQFFGWQTAVLRSCHLHG